MPASWPRRLAESVRRVLPEGKELPEDEWRARHRAILLIIWLHAAGILAFGLYMGAAPALVVAESAAVALIGALAAWPKPKRRFRGAIAGLALVTSSAAIVQFSGGYIEAHFHFFVILAVIALYQDWVPFSLAIAYVALDHGIIGAIFPTFVYNHPDAFAHPWKWAIIHAALVLGESAALLMGWKIAENARRRTALVLDSAGEGILGLDLEGRITFANPAAAHMTQRDVGELQGMRIDAILRSAEGQRPLPTGWLPSDATMPEDQATRLVRKDGTAVQVEWDRTPIRNNNVVIGAVMSLRDVTERKRAEEALRRAVSTLTATLESTTDGILVIDQSGKISGFNRKFVEMWRIPMSVLSSGDDTRSLEYVQDQVVDPVGFRTKVKTLYEHPEETSFDVIEFKNGRIVERYSQPQRSGDAVIGRVWSFRDVTERVLAEKALREQEELQATNTRLRELDAMKTQFINNAAHELGTPLTPIKLQAHMLNSERLGPLSDKQRHSVKVLSRNVDQLGALLSDVLDSARVQAGRVDVEVAPVALESVATEAVESFADSAEAQGVALNVRIEKPVTVNADARRLTQVLFNLIRNALRFTPKGGAIDVVVGERDGRAFFEVRDSGRGLKPEDIQRLFQPFSQVHDLTETARGGTGLGLYIARGIIETHGGDISCESPGIGKGATFRVRLPMGA
ncbi:MAG TPA: PAS domain-containing sensor histidine kinase [Candidatus Thermoplasmatota archaeon]|nr:PAS domain-containing sensor histidine kinase [Candidatus Thermoplasmatota archaeon]